MKTLHSIFLLSLFVLLTSCGKEDVCVMGMGSCDTSKVTKTTDKTTQSGGTALTVKWDAQAIKVGEKATATASGGTKPYTFSNYQGPGSIIPSTATENTVVYQASDVAGIFVIQVTDANRKHYELGITVTQQK